MFQTNAFAVSDVTIVAQTDKQQYLTGEILSLSGSVSQEKMPVVALRIFNPDNFILVANNIPIINKTFSKDFLLTPSFYDKSGLYKITLEYGKAYAELFFEVKDNSNFSHTVNSQSFLQTNKSVYHDGDLIIITGKVSTKLDPSMLIGIYDSYDNPTGFYFADIHDDLHFSVSFLAKDGVNFKNTGIYSVVAYYGENEFLTTFEFQEDIADTTTADTTTADVSQNQNLQQIKYENLSVDDVELGLILNQMNLNCDKNDLKYSIMYYDGMEPALLRLCKYSEALNIIETSLQNDPYDIKILTNKGVALSKLGYHHDALIVYDDILKIDSNFLPALNNKANVLVDMGEYDKAQSLLLEIINSNPDYSLASQNLIVLQTKLISENLEDNNSKTNRITPFSNTEIHSKTEQNSEKSITFFDQMSMVFSSIFSIFK